MFLMGQVLFVVCTHVKDQYDQVLTLKRVGATNHPEIFLREDPCKRGQL